MAEAILFHAFNSNSGLHSILDWQFSEFTVTYSGEIKILVQYGEPVVDVTIKLDDREYNDIYMNVLSLVNSQIQDKTVALDGDKWAFEAYDKDGRILYQRRPDYTYGIKEYEHIQEMLEAYMPEYEEPAYSKEDIERIERKFFRKL